MDRMEYEIKKRVAYLTQYTSELMEPIMARHHEAYKGIILVDGKVEIVYHDWYNQAMDMVQCAVTSKKESLNEELVSMFGKPNGTIPFYL
jgi:hypothetical protein